jgi:hypothetical protein
MKLTSTHALVVDFNRVFLLALSALRSRLTVDSDQSEMI